MPRLDLRRIAYFPHDDREAELRILARGRRITVQLSGAARRAGRPHVVLWQGASTVRLGEFANCAAAIDWLQGRGARRAAGADLATTGGHRATRL